ncbi:MAG TPA: EamA family transporter [Spirochaetota bacterium]|jgi:drug/metabolite transporter (DMT)-like permease|nr:EamA family transporter [Spirochaetota bacterium]OPZ37486.1 MAG: EamA-like transporter family protein [Spirochaetes bacterium ADurb.BinA120]HNU91851.1 EamA family transporter [Spirochaetota bacterium]HPI13534.1 EamA family transporter [Spirochaetota bacterium]HPO44260.1 EamA family transporter [Spirochaetota bacterium]
MNGTGEKTLPRSAALACLLGAAVLWSLAGLLIKSIDWDALAIAGARSAIAVPVLMIYIRRPRFTWSAAQITGAAAYTATVILFVLANKLTTAANAILLQYTAPLYVAVLGGLLLKERAGPGAWAALAGAMGGMFFFFMDSLGEGGLSGNILALASGLSFAVLIISLRMQKDGSPIESILLGNVITALLCAPFMFSQAPPREGLAPLAVLGIFQLGLAYILYSAAIRRVTALEAVLVPAVEPLLNPLWVFLALGETPGPWSFAGGAVVLFSVTAFSAFQARGTVQAPAIMRRTISRKSAGS